MLPRMNADMAADIPNRKPVGFNPEVAVLAAEKRIMDIITSSKGNGPLCVVEDYVWNQKRGAVHWHILLWCKPGTVPANPVMAEVPRGANTACKVSAYLRKLALKMQKHLRCVPNRCFKGMYGKKV